MGALQATQFYIRILRMFNNTFLPSIKMKKMKTLLIASLIGLLPIVSTAQDVALNETIKTLTERHAATSGNETLTAKAARKAQREKAHFAKTIKAFSRDFGNQAGVQWSAGKSDYTAAFTQDGVGIIAWYDKSGNRTYTVFSYAPEKLAAREQAVIAKEYSNYKIRFVQEVHQNDTVVYLAHLENDRHIKLVTICDGATNIYRDYRKQ